MSEKNIKNSELILNGDGSIYHLHLKEEHIAPTVILVGDQGRVKRISRHFDHIDTQIENREFITHSGVYKTKRLTVISTGIGTDNVDIVLNELDAAVNIDLGTRQPKPNRRVLNLIRIGTTGAMQADIQVGSFIISEYGLGFDGLMHYYHYNNTDFETELNEQIIDHLHWDSKLSTPYLIGAGQNLLSILGEGMTHGITATASGFYGPQGRSLYFNSKDHGIDRKFSSFNYKGHQITNFEMETSALYGLSRMMGHNACTCCAVLANRITKDYIEDHLVVVDRLILTVLDRLVKL